MPTVESVHNQILIIGKGKFQTFPRKNKRANDDSAECLAAYVLYPIHGAFVSRKPLPYQQTLLPVHLVKPAPDIHLYDSYLRSMLFENQISWIRPLVFLPLNKKTVFQPKRNWLHGQLIILLKLMSSNYLCVINKEYTKGSQYDQLAMKPIPFRLENSLFIQRKENKGPYP